jgi:formate dehydrogenase alpha subunit
VLPASTYAEKQGTFTNMTRHVQRVTPALRPMPGSKPDFDILVALAAALGKPFAADTVSEAQAEIGKLAPAYKEAFPGHESKQWRASGYAANPGFAICQAAARVPPPKAGYPFKLVTNNHMFHIGSYTQYCKSLLDIGPDCAARINRADAREMGIRSGDKIRVESDRHQLELPAEVSDVTARGMVYVPKNWVQHAVNMLRNGEEGCVSVKISKIG